MKRILSNTLFVILLALVTELCFADNFRKVPTIRENTYKLLSISQTSFEKNNPTKALSILEKLKGTPSLNSYEKAMMWNQFGAVYYGLERIEESITAYENLLKQKNFPKALQIKTHYNLAQLYFSTKQYSQVISQLDRWFSLTKKPTEKAYALQAQSYYYLENHQQVVSSINKALDIVKAKKQQPDEQLMVLMQSSLDKLGLAKHRLSILKWMVRLFPSKNYMLSLAGAYASLDKQKEQLAIMELAYKKGYLDTERLQLVLTTLFYAQGVPYKAAKIMQQGIENRVIKKNSRNLTLLSNCLRAAQEFEKAIPPLRQAATLSDNPDTYYFLGTTYYQLARWEEAVDAFSTAIDNGLTDRRQHALILLGQTYLQLHLFARAIERFTQAEEFDDSKQIAKRWIRYSQLEEQRYNILVDNANLLKTPQPH